MDTINGENGESINIEDELVMIPSSISPTVYLVILALMTALTTVATIVFVIPFPSTAGYFNLGDAMVMISGILLGPAGGFIAGGFGSAMGDVALGYFPYAPITFVVKGGEGLIVGLASRYVKNSITAKPLDLLGVILGAGVMLLGYFLGEVLLLSYSVEVALLELITINSIQVIMGGIIALIVGPLLRNFLRNYLTGSN
ncbi:MAG: ECF transporter S component [Candidatus Thorarchaeota archaeon]|nr:ECF transporter S component [Candidatus Thorarchaeota archaeon]